MSEFFHMLPLARSGEKRHASRLERQKGTRSIIHYRPSGQFGRELMMQNSGCSPRAISELEYETPPESPRTNIISYDIDHAQLKNDPDDDLSFLISSPVIQRTPPPWPLPPRSSLPHLDSWRSRGGNKADFETEENCNNEAQPESKSISNFVHHLHESLNEYSPRTWIRSATRPFSVPKMHKTTPHVFRDADGVELVLRACVSEQAPESFCWISEMKLRERSESLTFESNVSPFKLPLSPQEVAPTPPKLNTSTPFKLTPRALTLLLSLRSYNKIGGKRNTGTFSTSMCPPSLAIVPLDRSDSELDVIPSRNRQHKRSSLDMSILSSTSSLSGRSKSLDLKRTPTKLEVTFNDIIEILPSHQLSMRARSNSPKSQRNLDEDMVSPLTRSLNSSRHSLTKRQRSALSGLIEVEMLERLSTMNNIKLRSTAVQKFNMSAKDGIRFLIEKEVIKEDPMAVSEFLFTESGLSKRKMGEYFGRNTAFNQKVFEHFLGHLDFRGLTLDEALRRMVVRFRMPGEAQQIDRIMEHFAKRWYSDNDGGGYSCVDTAYILSFSLMMLNTDMYNRNLKESEKMSVEQFCINNRGIDQGRDLPQELLRGMYARLRENEIRMDEGDMFESEVLTFVAPKLSGWLKKKSNGVFVGWKRHWFVLVNGVLYYFFAPQDSTPRCIIPLERVTVQVIGPTDLVITATQGLVKSVKVLEDGRMQQGSHKEFILRAEKKSDRDLWLKELRNEALNPFVREAQAGGSGATPSSKMCRQMREHTSFESQLAANIPPPRLRGWARTQNEGGGTWTRRYCAIFEGVEGNDSTKFGDIVRQSSFVVQPSSRIELIKGPLSDTSHSPEYKRHHKQNVIYFFGSSEMCDRMVDQKLHTSHGAVNLGDVTVIELRTLIIGEGRRKAIVMYTYGSQDGSKIGRRSSEANAGTFGSRRWVFMPEDQYDDWVKFLIKCCPRCGVPITKDEPLQVDTDDLSLIKTPPNGKSPSNHPPSPTWSRRTSVTNTISMLGGNFTRRNSNTDTNA